MQARTDTTTHPQPETTPPLSATTAFTLFVWIALYVAYLIEDGVVAYFRAGSIGTMSQLLYYRTITSGQYAIATVSVALTIGLILVWRRDIVTVVVCLVVSALFGIGVWENLLSPDFPKAGGMFHYVTVPRSIYAALKVLLLIPVSYVIFSIFRRKVVLEPMEARKGHAFKLLATPVLIVFAIPLLFYLFMRAVDYTGGIRNSVLPYLIGFPYIGFRGHYWEFFVASLIGTGVIAYVIGRQQALAFALSGCLLPILFKLQTLRFNEGKLIVGSWVIGAVIWLAYVRYAVVPLAKKARRSRVMHPD